MELIPSEARQAQRSSQAINSENLAIHRELAQLSPDDALWPPIIRAGEILNKFHGLTIAGYALKAHLGRLRGDAELIEQDI